MSLCVLSTPGSFGAFLSWSEHPKMPVRFPSILGLSAPYISTNLGSARTLRSGVGSRRISSRIAFRPFVSGLQIPQPRKDLLPGDKCR